MIRIFDIKRKNKELKNDDSEILKRYLKISNESSKNVLDNTCSKESGLTLNQVEERLKKDGKNIVVKKDNRGILYFLFESFKDEFIIILFFLAVINWFLGDKLGSCIIVGIATISALIRFFQDYFAYFLKNPACN